MPRTSSSAPSREILEVALQGLESQRGKLDEQISEVRRLLSGRGSTTKQTKSAASSDNSAGSRGRGGGRKKRALSAEARARIAAAQKKRWAAFRKSQG